MKVTIEYPEGVAFWDIFHLYIESVRQWLKAECETGPKNSHEPLCTYRWVFPNGVEVTMPVPTNDKGTRFVFRQGPEKELTDVTMDEVKGSKPDLRPEDVDYCPPAPLDEIERLRNCGDEPEKLESLLRNVDLVADKQQIHQRLGEINAEKGQLDTEAAALLVLLYSVRERPTKPEIPLIGGPEWRKLLREFKRYDRHFAEAYVELRRKQGVDL